MLVWVEVAVVWVCAWGLSEAPEGRQGKIAAVPMVLIPSLRDGRLTLARVGCWVQAGQTESVSGLAEVVVFLAQSVVQCSSIRVAPCPFAPRRVHKRIISSMLVVCA